MLPLKYHEAYRIYKQMKANHWEPDVIDMTRDSQQWNTGALTPKERWIIEMGVGYFSAAEGIVGDSVLHVIEDNLTAAELSIEAFLPADQVTAVALADRACHLGRPRDESRVSGVAMR